MDIRRIAHYEVTDKIGAGGMGEVYRARDTKLGRDVALKFLPAAFAADADRLARFEREARLLASLNHPNIAAIYGLEREGEQQVLVLELVEGEELSAQIARGPVPLDETLRVAEQVAAALEAAHDQGVIHRDLKPANIKVTTGGRVKVLDFGLAKALDPNAGDSGANLSHSPTVLGSSPTAQGVILGTAAYMAPEQARGKAVDRRADVWAFGCVVYEMLTGRMAFQGDTVTDILARILEREPVWDALPESVTPALRYVLEKCLAKDPADRWRSAGDVAMMMRRTAQSRGMGDAAASSAAAPPTRGNRWLWPAVTGLFAVALAWSLFGRGGGTSTPGTATQSVPAAMTFQRLTVRGGVEAAPKISPDGSFIVYQAAGGGDGDDTDIFFQRAGGGRPINLTENSPDDDVAPDISPDAQRIAFGSGHGGGGLFVMGATGESTRRVGDGLFRPSWAPDGKRVVASSATFVSPLARGVKGDLWIIDVDSSDKRQLTKGIDAVQPDWSPHGQRIAYWGVQDSTGGQRDVWTVGVEAGDIVPVTLDSPVDWNPVWGPDGRHLYFNSDRGGSFNVWRIAIDERTGAVSGKPEPVSLPAEFVGTFDVGKDGKQVVYSALSMRSNVYETDFDPERSATANEKAVTRGTLFISDFDVSRDGQWLAYCSGQGQEDLYVAHIDGSDARKLTDDRHRDRGPAWAADGSRIYIYSDRGGRYEYWSIRPDGGGLQQITETTGRSWWYPIPSPDGTRFTGHNESGAMVADFANLPLSLDDMKMLPDVDDATIPRMWAWSPDGTRLAGQCLDRGENTQPGIVVYSFETGAYQRFATELTGLGQSVAWLRDGRWLMGLFDGKLVRIDTKTGDTRVVTDLGASAGGLQLVGDTKAYYTRSDFEADIWMATQE